MEVIPVGMRVTLVVLLGLAACAVTTDAQDTFQRKESTMIARGTFDVKVTPQPQDDSSAGPFGRLFLDKQFHGDLQGTSKGQMLSADTDVEQSKAYVALELVTATLNGKPGAFILQHKGTMQRGDFSLDVAVVPDSGTGQLTGIGGRMTIHIQGRDHSYEFEYRFGQRH
jgi:hypothetical protein